MVSDMSANKSLEWDNIEFVLLDMDGTLLDKRFDDFFWEEYVPRAYAEKYNIPLDKSYNILREKYKAQEGTLNWTDLDYWSSELGLDIVRLKEQISSWIKLLPDTWEFLSYLQQRNKKSFLVTNAHPKTIKIKLNKTRIGHFLVKVLSAFEIGVPKDSDEFWKGAQKALGFRQDKTLFIDDDEPALESASRYGIKYLFLKVDPDSKRIPNSNRFVPLTTFKEIIV
jgi:putative hydrolase of the HAD superfamily